LQDSKQQHGHKRDGRRIEIDPADPPHAKQRMGVNQLVNGGEDNACQYRFGKIGQ